MRLLAEDRTVGSSLMGLQPRIAYNLCDLCGDLRQRIVL